MWYEILPSGACIFAFMTLALSGQSFVPYLFFGKPAMKRLYEPYEQEYWLRDYQLTGNPMKLQGLEAIPDLDDSKKEK